MPSQDNYPYRVFISYAKDDAEDAGLLFKRLSQLNFRPIWDHHTPGGWRFLDEIKKKIFSALYNCAGNPGATHFALLRACPWLSYFAPLAL